MKTTESKKARIEELRQELRSKCISYGELAELQSLVDYIDSDDVELLEAIGVPEGGIEEFKEQAYSIIGELEDLISTLPQKGDKASECQKICIVQSINELTYAINGLETSDLV